MLKQIKNWLINVKKSQAQKLQLKKMKKYYYTVRTGIIAIQFMQRELANSKNATNRHNRRRMEKSLNKGEITPEIVERFAESVDYMLAAIEEKLNPPKAGAVRINGGYQPNPISQKSKIVPPKGGTGEVKSK